MLPFGKRGKPRKQRGKKKAIFKILNIFKSWLGLNRILLMISTANANVKTKCSNVMSSGNPSGWRLKVIFQVILSYINRTD
jgi:hypothetical protein